MGRGFVFGKGTLRKGHSIFLPKRVYDRFLKGKVLKVRRTIGGNPPKTGKRAALEEKKQADRISGGSDSGRTSQHFPEQRKNGVQPPGRSGQEGPLIWGERFKSRGKGAKGTPSTKNSGSADRLPEPKTRRKKKDQKGLPQRKKQNKKSERGAGPRI